MLMKQRRSWWPAFWTTVAGTVVAEIIVRLLGQGSLVIWFLRLIWRVLATPVTLPVWAIALALFSVIAALAWLVRLAAATEPEWLGYRREQVLGAGGEWGYAGRMIDVGSLVPLCPRCTHRLSFGRADSGQGYYHNHAIATCENCGFKSADLGVTANDLPGRVGREIERKIRTEEYKTALESTK